ncbi:hypothetical protein [Alterisphingorhabdus coralli]|uniref:Uncharacterized protein n=1 Tax=Alterisphingorhabdus coralli TaxID=3071408 RepID=A0AA97I373_9SPHN|nr:hypothetical protein [Parasphingorhabdus sp. SCSIO 66989]WOE76475.1 hypothetical protein RB602_07110 [Parasphingorhabdus sp. SCSIO 66989]
MDPEPFVLVGMIMGAFIGTLGTLAIQFYGRRKARAAVEENGGAPEKQERTYLINQQDKMLSAMMRLEERISVVERISTEREGTTGRLSEEIEQLR